MWMLKVAKKRILFFFDFLVAKLLGKRYLTPEGVHLAYFTPYHQHMAKLAAQGGVEPEMMAVWKDKSRTSKHIYDVGGFNGIYGLVAAKENPSAEITIFEPDPTNVKHIEKNIKINGLVNCKISPIALTDFKGTQQFSARGTTASRLGAGSYTVACEKLDDFAPIELIKIDAAGAESRIIRGAKEFLESHPPIFLQTDNIDTEHEEMWRTLEELGYKKTFVEPIPSGERCILEAV